MGRVADKFLLFLMSIAVFVCSAAVLAVALEVVDPTVTSSAVEAAYADGGPGKVAAIAASTVLLILSVRFLFVSLARNRERTGTINQRSDFGEIRISLETVENLSLKAAHRVRGVRDLRARVRVNESGLTIQLRSVIDGETSIPQLTEEIQRTVKEYVEEITGIPVAGVTVYVANVVQAQVFKARVE